MICYTNHTDYDTIHDNYTEPPAIVAEDPYAKERAEFEEFINSVNNEETIQAPPNQEPDYSFLDDGDEKALENHLKRKEQNELAELENTPKVEQNPPPDPDKDKDYNYYNGIC